MGTRMTLKHVLPLSSSLTWTSSDFQNAANISRTDSCISTSISRSFTCCAIFKTCQIHRKGSIKRCVPQRRSFELQQRKHREDCRVSQIGRQRGRTWASYHQEHTSHSLGRKCLAAPVGLVQTNFQKLCVNLGDRNPSTRTPAEMRMRATSMIHYKMTLAMLNDSMGLCLRWTGSRVRWSWIPKGQNEQLAFCNILQGIIQMEVRGFSIGSGGRVSSQPI